uniref:Uncharacterized protein n=1 Tax=Anguilla anguilla TaxID=7936 RepID=A0A0E9RWL6_ANGAN
MFSSPNFRILLLLGLIAVLFVFILIRFLWHIYTVFFKF